MDKKIIERYEKRLISDRLRSKRYYNKHKDKLKDKRKEKKIDCECGSTYQDVPSIKNKHFKTKKHLKYLKKKVLEELPQNIKELIIQ